MRLRCLILVSLAFALFHPSRARAGIPMIETHGIEIALPDGWGRVEKGALTIIAPKKYKGRAIEILSIKAMPAGTAEGIAKVMGTSDKVQIAKVVEVERMAVKMVAAEGKVLVKDQQLDLDMLVIPVGTGATVVMSFIKGDQDPVLRKANTAVLLSAHVGGPKMAVTRTPPKKKGLVGAPKEYEEAVTRVVVVLDKVFLLPGPLPVKFEECGEVNAFYSPTEHSIKICHELFDYLRDLFKRNKVADAEIERLVRGTVTFAFFHEFGHALVGELGLAITGKGEDAADEIATLVLAAMGPNGQESALAAAQWFATMNSEKKGANVWYDEHSFDQQRMVAITCLLYGFDRPKFTPMMKSLGIPGTRLNRCANDYKARYKAWNQLLAPHFRNGITHI